MREIVVLVFIVFRSVMIVYMDFLKYSGIFVLILIFCFKRCKVSLVERLFSWVYVRVLF